MYTILLKECTVMPIADGIGISPLKKEKSIGIWLKQKCNLHMIAGIFLVMISLFQVQKVILYTYKMY